MERTTSVTPPPGFITPEQHPPRGLKIGLLLALFGALLVAGIVAYVFLWPSQMNTQSRALPGTLILNVQSWQTEEGRPVSGTVSYEPSSGVIKSAVPQRVLPPLLSLMPAPTNPVGIYGEGVEALLLSLSEGAASLVRFSVERQEVTNMLAESSAGNDGMFMNPVRSLDGSFIAYQRAFAPSEDTPARFDSYMVRADGTDTVSIGSDLIGLAFSADNASLLQFDASGLSIRSLVDGTLRTVESGIDRETVRARASADGKYLALVSSDGTSEVTIYAVDWDAARVRVLGTFDNATQLAFGATDTLLAFTADTAETYALTSTELMKTGSYPLTLPEGAQLVSWITP